ncbi:ATP-binding cassette domain-containing protein [Amycolatopsis acidiphila]|uniref:ATP-binding cassette domain-containing protein n=1 Tax=Amycolatopsis acidiphila TaxID=715473 RepID=A0A558AAD0_9PSEU|nr:ATP-binding cassette domain-containing protein [Amycolatopsis acidiphila]TVT21217.1 ATP-binding cassette domain-containing protein [Amycolatopsis acidiphila]UIJ61233.1 ATP-binding cassette domain-containing protein [Amycolatopsis acidiphila]GHG78662.1 ABC transporter ATP-binding protein [Amycolatopsis acidiphila]
MPKPVFAQPDPAGPAIGLTGVTVHVRRVPLIEDVDWRVEYGQHWVVLGRNGAGKTTMMSVAAAQRFPSAGTAVVLGRRMGRVDLRDLRTHIGLVSPKQRLPDEENHIAHTVVLTGHSGSVLPLWERYDQPLRDRATKLLELVGCAELADRPVRVCSQGERARVRLARALLADPLLLILDEPFAGLDMPSREDLLEALHTLARAQPELATVTVTHHLEEIPATTTHALLLRKGKVLTACPAERTVTSEQLSTCFERALDVHRINGRWTAHARV